VSLPTFVRKALRFLLLTLAFAGRATLLLIVVVLVGGALTVWWFRHRAAQEPRTVSAEVVLPRGTRAIELYFPQATGGGLDLETREVVEDQAEGETLVRTVVGALLDGPDNAGLARPFPDGVTLNHVYRDPGGGLYLDFSNTLRLSFRGGSTAEEYLVSSLLRTLSANVPNVSRVTITAGGQPIVSLAGHFRLDGPLNLSEWH
jgi:sporulation and spore germination protein